MSCPYLEYRRSADGTSFDHERAYCTVAGRFVQPMRADVCNDRYDLAHDAHCEIYLEHAAADVDADASGSADDDREPGAERSAESDADRTGGDE